jgi:hypothetical protein
MFKPTAQQRHAPPEKLFAGSIRTEESAKSVPYPRCATARLGHLLGVTEDQCDEAWWRIEATTGDKDACSRVCSGADAVTRSNVGLFS